MQKLKIAIVGHGFVGSAIDYGFSKNVTKKIIDPKYGSRIDDLIDFFPDVTFVCVPTPMDKDGSIDASIVKNSIAFLKQNVSGIFVLKSTVIPSIVEELVSDSEGDRVVYNPEFLTEKSANEDFVNPSMHVFGGEKETTELLENIYKKHSSCKPCEVFHMSAVEASFVKYGINSFLATKVLWFNQLFDAVEKGNGNYNVVVNAIASDKRIGPSHTAVPGFDGKRGFGGACFPKDTAAFLMYDQSLTVLREVIAVNNAIRAGYELDSREKEQNIKYK